MRNKGIASIWLLVSLLGILVGAELGLGYFFVKNKEEMDKNPKTVQPQELLYSNQNDIPFIPGSFREKSEVSESFDQLSGSMTFFGDYGSVKLEQDPLGYKNDNPAVKLSGSAAHFSGGAIRGNPINFIPSGENWDEGIISFDVKPESQPKANQWLINLNWNQEPNPPAGYVDDVMLTKEMKLFTLCWSWGQSGDGAQVISNSVLPIGSWSHVEIVWSKSHNFTEIYFNGKLDVHADKVCPPASNGNIYPWFGGFKGFYGWLDNVKFSN